MNDFDIWPTEALIIGRYVQEWMEAKRDCPNARFVQFFTDRMGQFVPDMDVYVCSPIGANDQPTDIEWTNSPQGRHGTSPSWAGVEFYR